MHLDIVPDLSTETFIRCLKRFTARRGLPYKFISDNGKTFQAAAKATAALFNDKDVHEYLSSMNVEWSFNIKKASWWGGFFERMVKSATRCLRKMIGQSKFNMDELSTAVAEVEAIINSRPMSYISPDDLEEPLTPSHLLLGRRVLSLPDNLCLYQDPTDDGFEVSSAHLDKRMRHLNNLLNHFWKRWRNEYLLGLRDSHRQGKGGSSTTSQVKVGDIVIVHDKNSPRGFWKLAKIEDVIIGRDGKIRGAVVKQSVRNNQATLLRRPLQLLYPLEVRAQENTQKSIQLGDIQVRADEPSQDNGNLNEPNGPDEATGNNPPPRRSQRAAATQANAQMQACAFTLED